MTDQRNEIVQHDGGSRAVGIPMDQRMAMLREALTNPDVNPEKAAAMAELIWKMEDREREAEFNRAKIAAINEMPAIFKRGENTHTSTRYAKFEDYHRAIMPVLKRHGLTLDFRIGSEGRDITVQPILRHENGYVEEGGIMRGPADEGKGRSAIQAVGSASSYLKRYSMRAMLNIVEDGEDNDGAGFLSTDAPNDRQARLIESAAEAVAAGTYDDWFAKIPLKDRAWLISTGRHATFGGKPMLPGSDQGREEGAAVTPPPPADPPVDQGETARPKLTPRQWVDRVKGEITDCKSSSKVDEYLDGKREALARLKDSDPALHQEIIDHAGYRRDELDDGR
jgi:hypothetical protein